MSPTTRHRRHCSICNVPTEGLWMDRALCDACLDQVAEDMTEDAPDADGYLVAPPEVAHRYIDRARERAEEAYSDRKSENWRQW